MCSAGPGAAPRQKAVAPTDVACRHDLVSLLQFYSMRARLCVLQLRVFADNEDVVNQAKDQLRNKS